MRRPWYSTLLILSTFSLLVPIRAQSAPMESATVERTHWMKTMESAVTPKEANVALRVDAAFGDPAAPATDPNFLGWLGWFLAGTFFIVLLNLHMKMRRRQDLMLHGDGPDLFLLPPANNRRRRPR